MKRLVRGFIMYFPVILIAGQLAANILYVASPEIYSDWFFYIGALFGINWLMAIFMVAFTFYFKFCSISRVCAVTELLFGVVDLAAKDSPQFNVAVQIIAAAIALLITGIIFKTWTKEQS